MATPVARLETDEQAGRRVADLVAERLAADEVAVSLSDAGAGRWRLAIHFRTGPDEEAVRALVAAAAGPEAAKALSFERVAAKDWVRESLAGLGPVAAGRFIVHGAHDRAAIAVNRIGIEIEAALAFGSGHHGTTRGCLLALDRICKSVRNHNRHPEMRAEGAPRRMPTGGVALRGSPRSSRGSHLGVTDRTLRILDVGTGSGVLAIAAARALRQHVLATDIDPSAVRVARANGRLNRVGPMVEVVHADGVTVRRLRERAPFDLVFANILLRPLQRMAAPLQKLTARGGRVVLSGLLPAQANAARAAYHKLALERRIDLDGWTTLVMVRRTQPAGAVARRRPAT